MPAFPERLEKSLILGDCLEVVEKLPDASIDLVYIDPPFGTGKAFKGERLPIGPGGRHRAGKSEKTFRLHDRWEGRLEGYLAWIEPRLAGMARLLKLNGSLLVHLDWHAAHYVKVLLDKILGRSSFVNEIIWHYQSGGTSKRRLARKHDAILWYAKGECYTCHPEAAALPRNRCRLCGSEKKRPNHMKREKDAAGRIVLAIRSAGRVYRYYEDAPGPPSDVWLDIGHLHQRDPERTGYPAQKPLKLLERLVALCSNPGDLVADFFAGTGTTLIAAAKLDRSWVGCDSSAEALRLAAGRFEQIGLPHRAQGWEAG